MNSRQVPGLLRAAALECFWGCAGTDGNSSGYSSGNCGASGVSTAECPEGVPAMCGMLAAHNQVRAEAPGANPPLPPLVWDCSIAAAAQAYADTCPGSHSGNHSYGENIFWTSTSAAQNPAAVVNAWASEGPPHYEIANNYCDGAPHSVDNFDCGHYTQLVWRSTSRVGCGYRTGCPGGLSQPWVCNYAPPGNMYDQKSGSIKSPY